MGEMIERAAEAIYRSQEWDFTSGESFSDLTDGCKHVFRTAARAAIEAISELPEEPGPNYRVGGYSRRNIREMVEDVL